MNIEQNALGERLLDTKEVASLLKVSESWVREHSTTKEPRLPAMKLGEGKTCPIRFHPDDVQEFIQQQRERSKRTGRQFSWQ